MEWEAESDWEPDDPTAVSAGQCILIPSSKLIIHTDKSSEVLAMPKPSKPSLIIHLAQTEL